MLNYTTQIQFAQILFERPLHTLCILYNMEERVCTFRKRSRRRKFRLRTVILLWLCIMLALAFLFLLFLNRSIYPAMEALAQAKVKQLATEAMNRAIIDSVSSKKEYAQLLEASENGEKVYMLKADSVAMNKLSYECSSAAQKKLSEISELGIKLSVGTLSGIAPLSGRGPDIGIRFTPAANVRTSFTSSLQQSGINQTLYRVNIVLTSEVCIILPGKTSYVSVSADAAIAEGVIVGEVPQVYTNVEDEEDMLNLVPTELP